MPTLKLLYSQNINCTLKIYELLGHAFDGKTQKSKYKLLTLQKRKYLCLPFYSNSFYMHLD